MPHLALLVKQGALTPRIVEVEVIHVGHQPLVQAAATVRGQSSQLQKACSIGKASIELKREFRSGVSIVDAEPIADTSSWRVEQAFLAASDDLPEWQDGEEATDHPYSPSEHMSSSKDVFGRGFSGINRASTDVGAAEECVMERPSGSSLRTENPSSIPSSHSSSTVEHLKPKVRNQVSMNRLKAGPEKHHWHVYMEDSHGLRNERAWSKTSDCCLHQLEEKILFIESMGIDSNQLLIKYPLFSNCSLENLRAVVRFLEDCNLRRKDVVRILTHNPSLLGHSVGTTFRPVLEFLLQEVKLQEKDVPKVLRRCPRLLLTSVDKQLRPTMLFLQSLGFTHMPIVVSNNATLLTFKIQDKLQPKIDFLQTLGLNYQESLRALIRFPAIFNYSIENNLRPKYRYLVEVMGRGVDDLKAFPQYFGYNLEDRIQYRHLFLQKCNICLSLPNMLKQSDEGFHERFQHEHLQLQESVTKVSSARR